MAAPKRKRVAKKVASKKTVSQKAAPRAAAAPGPKIVPTSPGASPTQQKSKDFTLAKAWTPALARTRYVGIVKGFLEYYSQINVTHGEAMFIIHPMSFKWGTKAPYPSYERIAGMMGCSDKMARRYAKSLQDKKLLLRTMREATTNQFDLTPLFHALELKIYGAVQTDDVGELFDDLTATA